MDAFYAADQFGYAAEDKAVITPQKVYIYRSVSVEWNESETGKMVLKLIV